MEEFEKKELLEKIDHDSSFVGTEIPEKTVIEGEEFDLRNYVVKAKRRDGADDLTEVKKKLRRRRTDLHRKLSEKDASETEYSRGKELVRKIKGIDRGLSSLEQVGRDKDLDSEEMAKEKADQMRWKSFVDKVKGEDNDDRRRHG